MEFEQIKARIIQLEIEHRDLDTAIDALAAVPGHDELQARRLKKQRLQLRDEIIYWQMQLEPDRLA